MCQVTTHVEKMLRTTYSVVYFDRSPGVGVGPVLLEAWGGGWASITGGLVGQRTAPPLLFLPLSFNNFFSMSNFILAIKRYLICYTCIVFYCIVLDEYVCASCQATFSLIHIIFCWYNY